MAATIAPLLKRLGLLLGIYTLSRIGFFWFNRHLFQWVDGPELLRLLVFGLRFDLAALAVINALFILLSLLPVVRMASRPAQAFLLYLYVLPNSVALLLNCVDFEYFRFINKRATSHLFHFITLSDDVLTLIPRFIQDFWYVAAAWIGLTWLLVRQFRRSVPDRSPRRASAAFYAGQSLALVLGMLLTVIAVRGGLQDTPISLKTAGSMTEPKNVALLINTPFSIISTLGKRHLEPRTYFSAGDIAAEEQRLYHRNRSGEPFKPRNVVIFILESFSREYMGPPYGEEALTPFLDTLAHRGLFCSRAFANGTDSISGIPAVVNGIPSLDATPFINSPYAANPTDSLAVLLGGAGYHTSFFHGAKRGSLDLDTFAGSAGFQHYFGLDDFVDNDRFQGRWGKHDKAFVQQVAGLWGVHDDPFFQYVARQLETQPRPFLSVVFSLSSHHPYALPREVETQFAAGSHPIHRTVRYADEALRRFFETVAKTDWYRDTLFVITADHTAQAGNAFYKTRVGRYAIPLIYYCPGDPELTGMSGQVTQQIDILPTILDYLKYDQPFFGFGDSIFQTDRRGIAISFQEDIYQLIRGDHALTFNGEHGTALYDYAADPVLGNNLLSRSPETAADLEKSCKLFIQTYNQAMIQNRMTARAWK